MKHFDVQRFTFLRTALLQNTLSLPCLTAPQWSVNLDSIPKLNEHEGMLKCLT